MNCTHCGTPLPDGSRFCPMCGTDTSDPRSGPRVRRTAAQDLLARVRLALADRYDVLEMLGRGGMGAIFRAVERSRNRAVAIKVLPPELAEDEKFVARFAHEARAAAQLDHPNIVPIYAVEGQGDLHYFVMRLIEGRSLEEILRKGQVPLDFTRRVLWEAACALGHAHQRGVIHRDIKPANMMIDESGHAMLADFGIAKALESAPQFTATGQLVGTPHYMSPEQAKGSAVDGRTDQYSLAVVGYRMISGHLPFTDDSVHTVLYKHIFEKPARLQAARGETPVALAGAIGRALSKDPAARFPTMEMFASAVWPEQAVSGPTTTPAVSRISLVDAATQVTLRPRLASIIGRAHWKRVAVGGLLVVGGATGWWAWRSRSAVVADGLPGVSQAFASRADSEPPASSAVAADTSSLPSEPDQGRRAAVPMGQSAADAPASVKAANPRPDVGYVTINATNTWGTVYVDGVEVGDTPVVRHSLPAGRHMVEIRQVGYAAVLDTVTVTAGNELRLSKTLIPRP